MASHRRQTSPDSLSKRAVEILRLLAEGMSDREIAERLVMTVNTVKWYNRQIYNTLGVGSRTQAIARARELQLLDEHAEAEQIPGEVFQSPRHNLPVEPTRFIGRKYEIEVIEQLLDSAHILTLVGSPGTGKTRLALQIGWEMVDAFQGGVYFVSLAPISDPSLVMNTIARAIGVSETQGQPLIETLKRVLRESHTLLILDNFEHLLSAASQISDLLTFAPHLKILATSREPLHIYGEQEYAVPPLALPDLEHFDPQALVDCESVALFLQQARAVRANFEMTAENALDIAQICVRLEGLPLAIELAAARIKLLTPRTLLARLMSRLDTLTGGAQDLLPRQQTLHNTIEWSYNLLDEGEKRLFSRLAVFQGGFSLEAIEAVCSEGLPINVFDGLDSLANKSLIQSKDLPRGESRFVMLETLHEYTWKHLRASGEAQTMQRRHAEYFVQLAERAEPELRQADFSCWMERLESEHNNLRAALQWSFAADSDVELGLRLVAALRDFWIMSNRVVQAEGWIQHALERAESALPELRIRTLIAVGLMRFYSPQQRVQRQLLEQAVALARAVDDRVNLAWALIFLSSASIGQPTGYEDALSVAEEGLSIFRELADKPGIAQALNIIGELARTNGDDEHARIAYEECLRLVRETGEARRESMILSNLGFIAMRRGDIEKADQLFRQSLGWALKLGYDKHRIVSGVLAQVGTIAARGDARRAAQLIGAAEGWLERMGVGLQPGNQPEHERNLATIRSQLDATTFDQCWHQGHAMSLDEMVASALEFEPQERTSYS